MNKVVVYSCIAGGRDIPLKIKKKRYVDYFMFTDDIPDNTYWEYRSIPEEWKQNDPRLTAKYPKINPHKILPEYNYWIWIDGNIKPAKSIRWFLAQVREHDAASKIHPARNCAYVEASLIKSLQFDYDSNVDKIINIMQNDGYADATYYTAHCISRRYDSPYLTIAVSYPMPSSVPLRCACASGSPCTRNTFFSLFLSRFSMYEQISL
jgi:hypothetical protein